MASAEDNNSFKKLAEIEANQAPQPSPQTERNVMGTARNVGFLGNVVELYFSKALGMLSTLFGGSDILGNQSEDVEDLRNGNFDNDSTIEPGGRAN